MLFTAKIYSRVFKREYKFAWHNLCSVGLDLMPLVYHIIKNGNVTEEDDYSIGTIRLTKSELKRVMAIKRVLVVESMYSLPDDNTNFVYRIVES